MKTIEQKVIKFVEEHRLLKRGDKVCVALSGGPDSVFALFLFLKLRQLFGIELSAFHVNHQLRGKDSDGDELFCEELCEKLSIPFSSVRVDVISYKEENKLSLEEAARVLRYQAFEKVKTDKIITAHNLDDNAETMFMNFIKGAGVKGLSGIPVVRERYVRPLLCISKKEVLKYLEQNKNEYRIDATNNDQEYQRNYIRHTLLKGVEENLNASVKKTMLDTSERFRGISASLELFAKKGAEEFCLFTDNKLELHLSYQEKWGKEFLPEILRYSMEKHLDYSFDYSDYRTIRMLEENQKGRKGILRDGLTAVRESDSIVIVKSSVAKDEEVFELKIGEKITIGEQEIGCEIVPDYDRDYSKSEGEEFISADNLTDIFILRHWKSGDKFVPLGMNGTKKISDFLTEKKMPATEKENQFVLQNRNDIVWVVGFRIDNRYRITSETKRVCRLWVR